MVNGSVAASDLELEIMSLFSEKLNINLASPRVDLIESGLLDSMLLMELTMALEQRFGIQIDVNRIRIEDLTSVSAIAEFVKRLKYDDRLP